MTRFTIVAWPFVLVNMVMNTGCGLDGAGLLAGDSGVATGSKTPHPDAMAPQSDDEAGVTGDPSDADPQSDPDATVDDAAVAGDVDLGGGGDGSPFVPPPGSDAATVPDGSAWTPGYCQSCAQSRCPTQLAACGAGSECVAYRKCQTACSTSTCTKACGTQYPSGESALTSLTLCEIGCGGACVAILAVTGP